MTVSLAFYSDAALTTPLAIAEAEQDVDGIIAPEQIRFWIGSTVASRKFEAVSDPGIDDILLSVADSNAGSGQPVAAIKLSFTQAGLASAVAGAAINLGTQILSGTANKIEMWMEVNDQTSTVGNYTDLSLQMSTIQESPV